MTNPRKFSEKIALHNQKQAEETAAFQQIMREVMDVRPFSGGGGIMIPVSSAVPQQLMQIQNQQQQQQQQQQNHLSIALGSYRGQHGGSLPNVNQMAQQGEKGLHVSRGGYAPSSSPRSQRSTIGPVRIKPSHRETSPYASPPSASMLSSSMSSATAGGFGSSGGIPGRIIYAPNSYLSPPMDSSCRRFNSDSALNLNTLLIPSTVPDSSEDSSNNSNDYNTGAGLSSGFDRSHIHDPINIGNHVMSRSRTGGDPQSHLEIPPVPVSMSSTGSLPDLTNFQYPPPLQHPVDPDEQSHSPYSTSPLTGSSITYSPTSSHASPQGAGSGQQQSHQHQHQQQQQQHQQQHQQNHQRPQQVQIPQSPHSPGSQTPQPSFHENHHPLHVNTSSFQNFTNDNMLSAYRSPQRPSPQNSPSPFRSASPSEGQLSGPSSPGLGHSTQSSANEYYLTQQAQALQQHFEQISVRDEKPDLSQLTRQWRQGSNAGGPYLYSAQQGHPMTGTAAVSSQHSPQHQQPQTPQTPSSIPDIIFTDFSDPRGADQLQLEEILASEQMQAAFRDGLGQIDFDGFQMLDQPDLVQLDPQVEDSFRLDRL